MPQPLLEIENLSIRFRNQGQDFLALNQVNLHISKGETLALVGESGSGKTLTGLAILQILPNAAEVSDQSKILLDGNDLLSSSELMMRKIRGKRISMIFQEAITAFNPVLTIGEQIDEVLKRHLKLSFKQRQQRILALLEEVSIPDPVVCAKSYPHTLSGGMRQRAMIAMALAPDPDLIIADEPTTAVDVTIQAQILAMLRNIQQRTNMAMLFITHDLGIVREIATRVAVISQGKIVEEQPSIAFFKQPQHPYSKQLFAALPTWDKRAKFTPPHHGERELSRVQTSPPSSLEEEGSIQPRKILEVSHLKIYFPVKKGGIFQHRKTYVKAVDDVSFSITQGQTYALVGESGSGKTTIAKSILRLIKTTGGDIHFLGEKISHLSSQKMQVLRGNLQMIFQDPYSSLDPRMHIDAIIAEGILAQKQLPNFEACQPKIDDLLQRVGLPSSIKNRFPHEFSGGQRQRISIARALAMQPQLIICDEPTSALDVIIQMEILRLLRELQKDLNVSYLLITHNIAVVGFMADYVGVMHGGKMVEQGPVEQILFAPQHWYTKQLLSAVPQIGIL